jgi:hypothetical protein
MRLLALLGSLSLSVLAAGCSCSAGVDPNDGGGGSGASSSGPSAGGSGGGFGTCGSCFGNEFTGCDDAGNPLAPVPCVEPQICAPGFGCADCVPGGTGCVGNEVHECDADGKPTGPLVETCDGDAGLTCDKGECKTGCEIAADSPSNVGCEFWAVDLDQQDGFNDPASIPWGLAFSNTGDIAANITIEINDAPYGEPVSLTVVEQETVPPNSLLALNMPTRELDCGVMPNDYASPGTCLSSRAFRIRSSAPIIAYQFNVFENSYSNDASLLLPTKALGTKYRVLGWGAGHPVKIDFGFDILDRSYVTIVGTEEGTQVTVNPSWRIKGNPPIDATPAGGTITVNLGPFDVLNLETDDGTFQDPVETITDLSGTAVTSTKPVAVFTGVESTAAPGWVEIPTYPGWSDDDTCCLDHLEDQLFPLESVGKNYVITRSPVRSTGGYREPDVIRFVGAAETATITTTLPAPFDQFTLQPGEVRTTWAQNNFTAVGDKPFILGQFLISQGYVQGALTGDPALTIFPPVEQYRSDYLILTPPSWSTNWVVISAPVGSDVQLDGASTAGCTTEPAGLVNGVDYQSRICPVSTGVHRITSSERFGVVEYGYGNAGSYALVGGADVKPIYEVPPIQ